MNPEINQDSQQEQVADQPEGTEKSKKARKRNKNKKAPESEKTTSDAASADETSLVVGSSQGSGNAALTQTLDADFLNKMKNFKLEDMMKLTKEAGQAGKVYKFWSTQPVPQMSEDTTVAVVEGSSDDHKAIEPDKPIAEIKQDPYPLPEGFVWETMDLNNEVVLRELYTLLNENYVEDDDAMFRFDYQPEFLRWALQPPHWRKEWHVG